MAGKFTVEIELGDGVLSTPQELAEALRELATRIEDIDIDETQEDGVILDDDGNEVGTWEYENELEEE